MISLKNRPPELVLSGMPAWFAVKNTGESKKVKATIKDGGLTIASQYAYASIDNTAHFELSEYFGYVVKPEYVFFMETENLVSSPGGSILKNITITFEDDYHSSIETQISVLFGELSPDVISAINYGSGSASSIWSYLSISPVLSLKPAHVNVYYKTQPERLFLLFTSATAPIDIYLDIIYWNGLLNTTLVESFTPDPLKIYAIRTSYSAICQPNILPEKDGIPVSQYRVRLMCDGIHLCNTFFYNVHFNQNPQGCFMFINSLGGFDTFCPTGSMSVSHSFTAKHKRVVTAPGTAQPIYRISDRKATEVITQSTGHVSREQINWLSQMIFSPKAFWVPKNGSRQPISFLDNKLEVKSTSSQLFAANIKYIINPEIAPETIVQ